MEVNHAKLPLIQIPFGPAEPFSVENLVKQGIVLGHVLYGTSIGDYCKPESNPHSGCFIDQAEMRSLAFMGDLMDLNKDNHNVIR